MQPDCDVEFERRARESTLLAALRIATGIADLGMQPDGEIALRLGNQPVWVRVLHDQGAVLVYSALVADVDGDASLLEWINRLNAAMAWVRFAWRAGVVHAELWLADGAADAVSLQRALRLFADVTQGVGHWLQRRCGGGSIPGDDSPPPALH